jgi:hypothetical protein
MRAQGLSIVTAAALMTLASTSMALAADSPSSAHHVLGARSVSATVKPAAAVSAAAPRRCVTIGCPGYLIVGIAY